MEVSALDHAGAAGLNGRSPLLRLQSDERLVALVRRGNHHAFEALVARYQSRLLAFCRHMLGSREDAEDVLQEVFASAFNAMLADAREINVRPWLYRIARNRSLNHLRRAQAVGVDSMDHHFSEGGQTTAEKVGKREEFRLLMADVRELPESQRTALLLREIDALSYDQIAEAMETTVPSVKSLLVRARVSLAEAAEARLLTCEEVRLELGEVAEGLRRTSPPVRRHLRTCERCSTFRRQLRNTNRALAMVLPVGPLLLLKKTLLAHLGTTAAAGGGSAAAASGGAGVAASAAAGGAVQAGMATVATKAAAGLAAAAIVTAGAVEVRHAAVERPAANAATVAQVAPPPARTAPAAQAPVPVASAPQPTAHKDAHAAKDEDAEATEEPTAAAKPDPAATPAPTPAPEVVQVDEATTALPPQPLDPAAVPPPPPPVFLPTATPTPTPASDPATQEPAPEPTATPDPVVTPPPVLEPRPPAEQEPPAEPTPTPTPQADGEQPQPAPTP